MSIIWTDSPQGTEQSHGRNGKRGDRNAVTSRRFASHPSGIALSACRSEGDYDRDPDVTAKSYHKTNDLPIRVSAVSAT